MCSILREVEAEGMEKGIQKGKTEIIKILMMKNNCSAKEAMDMIDIPKDEQEEYTRLILG